jgi:hypothetical protein
MPVLKFYTSAPGHYILASVRGAVISFQLTKKSRATGRQQTLSLDDPTQLELT